MPKRGNDESLVAAMDKRASDQITYYAAQNTLAVGTVEQLTLSGACVRLEGSGRYLKNVASMQGVILAIGARVLMARIGRSKWVVLGAVEIQGSITPRTTTDTIVAAPTGLSITDTQSGFARIEWTASFFDIRAWELMIGTSSVSTGASTFTTDNSQYDFDAPDGTYYARVRAAGPEWKRSSWTAWQAFSITSTAFNTDHGLLDGLADDDHPQYPLKTGWDRTVFDDVTLTFTDGTRTVSLQPTGASFSYWIDGVQYTSTGDTVVIDDTEGVWYIYYSGSTLTASQTAWDFGYNKAFVASLYWDATNNTAVIFAPELHQWVIPDKLHEYLHETFGARWYEGLAVSDGGSDDIIVTAGEVYDEDIECAITDDAGSGWWDQTLSPAECPILYRSGANGYWRKIAATAVPVYLDTNVLQYNEWTGATWQLQDVTLNKYVAYWVIASTNKDEPVWIAPGQVEGTTLTAALDANPISTLTQTHLASQEHKVIARLMVQRIAGAPYYSIAQIDDYRNVADEPASGSSLIGDHGLLSGLGDDDHPIYVLADGTRDLAFTPSVIGDWPEGDPGDVDDALDKLAERLAALEDAPAAGGGGDPVFHVHGVIGAASEFEDAWIASGTSTITAVYIYCREAGSSSSTIVDVNLNGTTIFTTQANRPELAYNDADRVAKSGTPDIVDLVENDVLTFDIDQAAPAAEDLTVIVAMATSGGGAATDSTYTGAYADRPASSNDGDLFLPSNSYQIERDTGAVWAPWGPIFRFTPPVDGDFSWVNQGGATTSTTNGGVTLAVPASASMSIRIRAKSAPSTPYSATMYVLATWHPSNYAFYHLGFRDSGTSRLHHVRVGFHSGKTAGITVAVITSTSATVDGAEQTTISPTHPNVGIFLKVADNGTNFIFSYSCDGQNFINFYTVSRTNWLASPDQVWWGGDSRNSYPVYVNQLHWLEG